MQFDNPQNRGLLFGDGIFETMRVGPAGVWNIDAHLARLERTIRFFEISICFESIEAEIRQLSEEELCLVRMTIISKEGAFAGNEGGVFWSKRELTRLRSPRLIAIEGLYLPGYKLHEFKTTSYLRSVHCKNKALASGYDDGLMISTDGLVGESSSANVWAVFSDHVVTPNLAGILPGSVREKIIKDRLGGLPIEERPIKIGEFFEAEEIGLSSVGLGILAASSLSFQGREYSLPKSAWTEKVESELFDA